jgi:hypothetical protein
MRTHENGEKYTTELWYENPKERDNLEDLVIDGRIMLKLILMK